jgi:hypothetical protein
MGLHYMHNFWTVILSINSLVLQVVFGVPSSLTAGKDDHANLWVNSVNFNNKYKNHKSEIINSSQVFTVKRLSSCRLSQWNDTRNTPSCDTSKKDSCINKEYNNMLWGELQRLYWCSQTSYNYIFMQKKMVKTDNLRHHQKIHPNTPFRTRKIRKLNQQTLKPKAIITISHL